MRFARCPAMIHSVHSRRIHQIAVNQSPASAPRLRQEKFPPLLCRPGQAVALGGMEGPPLTALPDTTLGDVLTTQ